MLTRLLVTLALAAFVVLWSGCGGSVISPSLAPQMMSTLAMGTIDYTALEDYPSNPVIPGASTNVWPCVLEHNGQFLMWTCSDSGGIYLATSTDGVAWSAQTRCTGLVNSTPRRPRVVWNSTLSKYEMWYYTGGNDYSFTSIRRARSSDGLAWSEDVACSGAPFPNRPVFLNSPTTVSTWGPCQILLNEAITDAAPNYLLPAQNRYLMYYHMYSSTRAQRVVGLAVSADGLVWGAPQENGAVLVGTAGAWDAKAATDCTIFQDSGGYYHMYYGGGSVNYPFDGIGYASSPDGLTWTKAPEPLFSKAQEVAWRLTFCGMPAAVTTDNGVNLYFRGDNVALGLAAAAAPKDTTPPTITLNTPSPDVLWPPTQALVAVQVSGSATDESGVAQATLTVTDEYGVCDQTLDVTALLSSADGSFSQALALQGSRLGNDADGRTYTITLNATDTAGNAATPVSVTARCPRNAGRPTR